MHISVRNLSRSLMRPVPDHFEGGPWPPPHPPPLNPPLHVVAASEDLQSVFRLSVFFALGVGLESGYRVELGLKVRVWRRVSVDQILTRNYNSYSEAPLMHTNQNKDCWII